MGTDVWEVVIRVSLLVLGAALGAALTRYAEFLRLKGVLPNFLDQIDLCAKVCRDCFSIVEAAPLAGILPVAIAFISRALELRLAPAKAWREGAALLQEIKVIFDSLVPTSQLPPHKTLERLRKHGKLMQDWANRMREQLL